MLKLVGLMILVCQVELAVSQRSCHDNKQCNSGECCVVPSGILSRRDVDPETSTTSRTSTTSTTSTTTLPPGFCQAYRLRGEDCSSFFDSCRCKPGLRCEYKPPTTPSTSTSTTTRRLHARTTLPGTYTCVDA